ncbi:MAG: amino acid adenylation domain-containing protein [Gammaproteobacteria bacterium]|nr:amino acid adenylation domain-containing protein [Gammaproteobacteria bacterium]
MINEHDLRLIREWNQTEKQFPQKTVHQLFEEQVEKTPDHIAVIFENQQLTYKELNEKSNQLAHYLRKLGVKPNTFVAICLERSLEMIIGILGILKAGGVYVPLDPDSPQKRLYFILEDMKTSILLTYSKFLEKFFNHQNKIICLDQAEFLKKIKLVSRKNPKRNNKPDDLTYIIYTSGTTGKPKGVLLPHKTITNLIYWQSKQYKVNANKITQYASSIFDVSLQEIFSALLNGYELHIVPQKMKLDLKNFIQFIERKKINTVFLPTSLLNIFASEALKKVYLINTLKFLIVAGERLRITYNIRLLFKQYPNVKLINHYGPSETHVVTSYEFPGYPFSWNKFPPIGLPIANTNIYILNKKMQLILIGEIGELYIGGVGLARGYLNQPELTREKFIKNPFSDDPHSRLYKTGDLARWLPDGNLEFIGRIDNQVKIHGFRVEPEEIEHYLIQYPSVEQAIVVPKQKSETNQYLAAYLRLSNNKFSLKKLLCFLKKQLPEYMIPAIFFKVDKIPLTPNGKTDRKALMQGDYDQHLIKIKSYLQPSNKREKQLVKIWSEILTLPQNKIGVGDNFFQLGGHSLTAIQLIYGIQRKFLVNLSIKEIFQYPTIWQLAELINNKEKQKPKQCMIQQKRVKTFPLSQAQKQIWLHGKMASDLPLFNESFSIRIPHKVNVQALEKAINYLLKRHKILRAQFLEKGQNIAQRIQPFSPIKLPVVDLQSSPQNQRKRKAIQLATEQAKRLFDLQHDLLIRFSFFQIADQDFWLFITIHHLLIDAVALFQIFKPELETAYKAFVKNKRPNLPPVKLQYGDYILWEKNQDVAPFKLDLAYWKKQLQDLPESSLPSVYFKKTYPSFQGNHINLKFSKRLTQKLRQLAQQENVTYFMVLLSTFNLLLYRYTNHDDSCVGSIVAGRDHPETENMMGNFLNTIIFRNSLTATFTVRDLLQQIKKTSLETYKHRILPFQQVLSSLPNLPHQPIQIAFVIEPKQSDSSLHWTASQLEIKLGISLFDLSVELDESDGSLIGRVEYKTTLFNSFYIHRLIGHFKHLLEQITQNPEKLIPELELLTPKEQQTLLVEWNRTEQSYPQKTIIQLFEEQVKKTPNNIAVIFENQQLTYRELNEKSNQLAHYLKNLGVKPETPVAICVERSLEMIIGILGILKAGGAYVPLDPVDPNLRLAFKLRDSNISILLTQSHLAKIFTSCEINMILLDQVKTHKESVKNPGAQILLSNLAYVIYTSATTGLAKGVAIEHDNISQRLSHLIQAYHMNNKDYYLHYSSLSFDASLEELFLPILVGAALVIAPPTKHLDIQSLLEWMNTYRITTINTVPSFLQSLLDHLKTHKSSSPGLLKIISGGDQLHSQTVMDCYRVLPNVRLFNTYGPTETTIDATLFECYPGVEKDYTSIPIGKPIANTQVYVLDSHLKPRPVYLPGELYIGGAGVARGYLNHPKLTQEKFIKNPFSDDPSARLYKTGDIVRWLPDGNLEFIGRSDFQVKIRGFRIELGEIEHALLKHKSVDQAVVVTQEDEKTHDKRLDAYLVLKSGYSTEAISVIRQHLLRLLPHYMIPATFTVLNKLPTTASGKVNRKALPEPNLEALARRKKYTAPTTRLEAIITKIWSEILHIKRIGIHDDFFELGGHSIAAINTIAEINDVMGCELAVCEIYHQPTISTLAARIEERQNENIT